LIFATRSAFVTASSIPAEVNFVTVLAVIAPLYPAADYRASAALTYQRGAALPTGIHGEVQVDGVYWTPLYDRAPVNAAQFGVIGDGAVDGTTGAVIGTDNAPMLQAAIDYALQHGLNTVKIPDGAYRLDVPRR
jgi:polygalacturonase